MKKAILKVSLAAVMFTQIFMIGSSGVSAKSAEGSSVKTIAATTNSTTTVMTDNLAKYGLKKAVNLPVTVSSGGFSYTLHKIMIYDINSTETKRLTKLYGFPSGGALVSFPKYLIWTKVTIQNNTNKTLHGAGNDIIRIVPFRFQLGASIVIEPIWPKKLAEKTNSTEALWTYTLKPGQKITSYLAYFYKGSFDFFVIRLFYGPEMVEKYVVPE